MNQHNPLSPPTNTTPDLVALYRAALLEGVPLDEIDKKVKKMYSRSRVSSKIETTHEELNRSEKKSALPKAVRVIAVLIPLLFVGTGVFFLGSALLPFAHYFLITSPQLQTAQLSAPIPQHEILDITPVSAYVADESQGISGPVSAVASTLNGKREPVILAENLDYTNLANWFDTTVVPSEAEGKSYFLDIPEIDLHNVEVRIGGTDLDESLIQYPGTADPGTVGAPVIFGHSVLRQFYNPDEDNERRYNSIFSYIMTLDEGDEIFVTSEGVKYTYRVRQKTEVKPEDTYILAQRNDSHLLKLVTCTPEGTYLRRGVVTAELVKGG